MTTDAARKYCFHSNTSKVLIEWCFRRSVNIVHRITYLFLVTNYACNWNRFKLKARRRFENTQHNRGEWPAKVTFGASPRRMCLRLKRVPCSQVKLLCKFDLNVFQVPWIDWNHVGRSDLQRSIAITDAAQLSPPTKTEQLRILFLRFL